MAFKNHGRQYDLVVFGATGKRDRDNPVIFVVVEKGRDANGCLNRIYRPIDSRACRQVSPNESEMGCGWTVRIQASEFSRGLQEA